MERWACVDVLALPLQLLLRREPGWKGQPVAVVDRDKPQGVILWVNEAARRSAILPGQRFAGALSLNGNLRAGVVTAEEIEAGVEEILRVLLRFSPEVEPAAGGAQSALPAGGAARAGSRPSIGMPGVFWVNASGVARLFGSHERWAFQVRDALSDARLTSHVVVGFSRFGTYAVSRGERRTVVLASADEEALLAKRVPLSRLDIEPKFRDALSRLGITTVQGLLALPPSSIRQRFGEGAHRLVTLATGDLYQPLFARRPEDPPVRGQDLDDPEQNRERLLFLIKRCLDPLLLALAEKGAALSGLILTFELDGHGVAKELVRPAEPTLDARTLLELVRLRLEAMDFPSGVVELTLSAETVKASREQLRLFDESPRRDPKAATRAFARLRAELGNDVVVRAVLEDAHLPEARFAWEPLAEMPPLRPAKAPRRPSPMVRRIHAQPIALPPESAAPGSDGWLLRLSDGAVVRCDGPYILSGGWWSRGAHREYYLAETQKGSLLWVYYDRNKRRWFLHGRVE